MADWKHIPVLPLVYWKPRLGSPARGRNHVIQPKFKAKQRTRPGTRFERGKTHRMPSLTKHSVENRNLAPQNFSAAPPIPPPATPLGELPTFIADAAARGKKKRVIAWILAMGGSKREDLKGGGAPTKDSLRWDNMISPDGDRLLNVAATRGQIGLVKTLVRCYGADVNGVDADGSTALYLAAATNQAETLRVLHRLGAQIDKSNSEHVTPLSVAAAAGHLEATRALLSMGANCNQVHKHAHQQQHAHERKHTHVRNHARTHKTMHARAHIYACTLAYVHTHTHARNTGGCARHQPLLHCVRSRPCTGVRSHD